MLVEVAGGHVVGWRLAQAECAASWAAIMLRVPAPKMAVSDGSPGFSKAAELVWPSTKMQRRAFHAANQARRCTALKPKLEAGTGLLGIASKLKDAKDAESATEWPLECNEWCARWAAFLKEHTVRDGKRAYAHERLRKARRGLDKLVEGKALLAFVGMQQEHGGSWPSTNNAVESANARLKDMLRHHRGLPLLHRVKAIFWWCYMHTESPLPPAGVLRAVPTDDDVGGLFAAASGRPKREDGAPEKYGTGTVWEEFHMPANYRR